MKYFSLILASLILLSACALEHGSAELAAAQARAGDVSTGPKQCATYGLVQKCIRVHMTHNQETDATTAKVILDSESKVKPWSTKETKYYIALYADGALFMQKFCNTPSCSMGPLLTHGKTLKAKARSCFKVNLTHFILGDVCGAWSVATLESSK